MKPKSLAWVFGIASLAAPLTARAAEYYVAPTGSDSAAGSMTAPFATVERGQQAASAGDTVWIRGGVYMFSGTEDPVGERLAGLLVLIGRYRSAGLHDIQHDFYEGGRHEMLNETNRDEVHAHLLDWVTALLERPRLEAAGSGDPRRALARAS